MKQLPIYFNKKIGEFVAIGYCDKFEVAEIVNVVDENSNIILKEATVLEIKSQFWDGKSKNKKWNQHESEQGFKHWVKFDKR